MEDYLDTHKQCQHCGAYARTEELQYFEGLRLCPACLEALQEQKREKEEKREKAARDSENVAGEESRSAGNCEKCGRPADILYEFNGRRLCRICLETDPDYVSHGPAGAAQPIRISSAGDKGILQRLKDWIFGEEDGYPIEEIEEARPPQGQKSKKKD
ncbi:hypothetical protein GF415_04990 [Candidatus Micrarchaeota archaeon]|nr:hypothetical protein [Candidatus Micrarchaeota archaeon]